MITILESNNTKLIAAKTELDNALAGSLITQVQYDTYYPMLDNMIIKNDSIIIELNKNIGHKDVGNYSNINNLVNNPSKAKDEITRSMTKYKSVTDCASDLVNSSSSLDSLLNFFSSLPAVDFPIDYQSIINWLDLNGSTYNTAINSMTTSITDFVNNMTAMKNNVKTYINNIIAMAKNITSSLLPDDSPCATAIGEALLSEKSPEDLAFINSLKTGDKTSIINDKIKSIQI